MYVVLGQKCSLDHSRLYYRPDRLWIMGNRFAKLSIRVFLDFKILMFQFGGKVNLKKDFQFWAGLALQCWGKWLENVLFQDIRLTMMICRTQAVVGAGFHIMSQGFWSKECWIIPRANWKLSKWSQILLVYFLEDSVTHGKCQEMKIKGNVPTPFPSCPSNLLQDVAKQYVMTSILCQSGRDNKARKEKWIFFAGRSCYSL